MSTIRKLHQEVAKYNNIFQYYCIMSPIAMFV